jgi:hypothetical protein
LLTNEDMAELAALLVTAPTARNIAKAVKAVKLPRPPRPPKVPAPPADRAMSRLRGAVTMYSNKVARADAAHAAIAAAKGTKSESTVRFFSINALVGESSDRADLARAQAALDAYVAYKAQQQ